MRVEDARSCFFRSAPALDVPRPGPFQVVVLRGRCGRRSGFARLSEKGLAEACESGLLTTLTASSGDLQTNAADLWLPHRPSARSTTAPSCSLARPPRAATRRGGRRRARAASGRHLPSPATASLSRTKKHAGNRKPAAARSPPAPSASHRHLPSLHHSRPSGFAATSMSRIGFAALQRAGGSALAARRVRPRHAHASAR